MLGSASRCCIDVHKSSHAHYHVVRIKNRSNRALRSPVPLRFSRPRKSFRAMASLLVLVLSEAVLVIECLRDLPSGNRERAGRAGHDVWKAVTRLDSITSTSTVAARLSTSTVAARLSTSTVVARLSASTSTRPDRQSLFLTGESR